VPNFGDRLKELRKAKGNTQKTMADLFDMTESSYRRYEINRSTPHHETFLKLADYFEVSLDYLAGRSDNHNNVQFTRTKFAERLESLRTKKAVTQKAIANHLGIPERAYQLYEYDKREPSQDDLIKLASYFNVSLDYLLGCSDNPERH